MKHFRIIPESAEHKGKTRRGIPVQLFEIVDEDAEEETGLGFRALLERDRTGDMSSSRWYGPQCRSQPQPRRSKGTSHSRGIKRYIIRGGVVYDPVIGGPDRAVGYVRNGIAYEPVIGGPDRPILDDIRIG